MEILPWEQIWLSINVWDSDTNGNNDDDEYLWDDYGRELWDNYEIRMFYMEYHGGFSFMRLLWYEYVGAFWEGR